MSSQYISQHLVAWEGMRGGAGCGVVRGAQGGETARRTNSHKHLMGPFYLFLFLSSSQLSIPGRRCVCGGGGGEGQKEVGVV